MKERIINSDEQLSVTSLDDLQSYSKGTLVRFPDFAEGQPLVARVKRPSMLMLAKEGKIPNQLLKIAGDLFSKGGSGIDADKYKGTNLLADMYDICKAVCRAALIEPTIDEIEGAGLTLTDEQIMAIFNYTQVGIKALENFRKE